MAKNQINFSKMDETTKKQLDTFKKMAIDIAKEDLRFKAEMKPLKARKEAILASRDNDLKQGMSIDDVAEKFPLTDVDNDIRKAETNHKAIVEPLNKAMKETYSFVPETLYNSYVRKIEQGKRGDFLNDIESFLNNLGIENCSQAQVRRFAESMSDKLGAKYATSKAIVNDGTLVATMKKSQFSKLFLAVFCDTYIK